MDAATTIFKNGTPFILTNADMTQFVDGEVYPVLDVFTPTLAQTQTADAWIE